MCFDPRHDLGRHSADRRVDGGQWRCFNFEPTFPACHSLFAETLSTETQLVTLEGPAENWSSVTTKQWHHRFVGIALFVQNIFYEF